MGDQCIYLAEKYGSEEIVKALKDHGARKKE